MPSEFSQRLRLYPTPTTRGDVIRHTEIGFQTTREQAGSVSLTVTALVADEIEAPFYAAVELRGLDGVWRQPRNDLYVFHESEQDENDRSKVRTFTGTLWVADRAGCALILPNMALDGSVTWVNASAGAVMADLLTRYPLHRITHSFTPALDSDGRAWPSADKSDHTASEWTSYGSVLAQLTSGGYCDWYSRGTELVLLATGTGTAHGDKFRIGVGADSVRKRESTAETATQFFIVSDQEGVPVQIEHRPDLGAGQRQAVVTVSGATTADVATRMAKPLIDRASQKRREITVSYQAQALPAAPLIDFQIGDDFTVAGGTYRLVGVQITRGTKTTVNLTFGEIKLDLLQKLATRAGQISFGSVSMTGGSGRPIPISVAKPNAEPVAPTGITVTVNEGSLRPNGEAYARVRLEWPVPTANVFGADTRVTRYELWARNGDVSAVPIATTTSPYFEAEWPLEARHVSVRAFNGAWSALSPETLVTPATPPQVTAPLSMPLLGSAFGIVTVEWDGANVLGDVGAEFNMGYVETAAAADGPWTRVGAGFSQAGQVAVLRGTAGLDVFVRFAWVDTLGRPGSTSTASVITVVGVTPDDLDSVPDFFANEAVIQNMRAGVLQAGVIEVDMLAPNVGELIDIRANEGVLIITQRVDSLEEAGQYYRFGPDGAIIGRVDDPTTLELRNDGASFNVNGVPATTWGPEGMDAPRMSSDEAVIGNLQFEKSGNRTIVRVVQT